MKQMIFIVLVVCVLLVGCRAKAPIETLTETQPLFMDATWQEVTDPPQNESTAGDITPATEGRSDMTTVTQPVSPETTPPPTESMAKNDNDEPAATVTEPPATTVPAAKETTQPTQVPEQETATEPSEPQVPKATAADARTIGTKVVEYLNTYRMEQGSSVATVLPGLTRYAEYRSRQLVSNFAHDTADERVAATALEYGSYIDPALYGMTGDPYYTANAREAIAKTDFGGSIEEVAAYLARMTHNSSSHWSYVGGAGYTYIGVGITYQNGVWYCNIAVTSKNTDS